MGNDLIFDASFVYHREEVALAGIYDIVLKVCQVNCRSIICSCLHWYEMRCGCYLYMFSIGGNNMILASKGESNGFRFSCPFLLPPFLASGDPGPAIVLLLLYSKCLPFSFLHFYTLNILTACGHGGARTRRRLCIFHFSEL